MVYQTSLKGKVSMSTIMILSPFRMAPARPCSASKASVETLPGRFPTRVMGAPLLERLVRNYISSISKVRIWVPTLKNHWSASHRPIKCSSSPSWALIPGTSKNFTRPHFLRAAMLGGLFNIYLSTSSCSRSLQSNLFYSFWSARLPVKSPKTSISTLLFPKLELPGLQILLSSCPTSFTHPIQRNSASLTHCSLVDMRHNFLTWCQKGLPPSENLTN